MRKIYKLNLFDYRYRKILILSSGRILVQKGFLAGLILTNKRR